MRLFGLARRAMCSGIGGQRAFGCHRRPGSLDSSPVNEITVISVCKFLSLNLGNRKLPPPTIHTDQNRGENPNRGYIKTFHSGKMDVHLSPKLTLIG